MTTSSFLIGPVKEGLRKDVKPYAIPEDAFEVLTNAYQWRGRIVRRSGYTSLGRLANGTPVMGLRTRELFGIDAQQLIAFDTTQAYSYNGTTFSNLSSMMPVTWSGFNYQFFWTTNYAGAFWATNSKPGLNGYSLNNSNTFTGQTTSGGNYFVNVGATGNTFVIGDQVYFLNSTTNNLRQGVVTSTGNTFTVQATDGSGAFSNGNSSMGIVLSSTRTVTGQDGIRYYANCTTLPNTSVGNTWVNYNPPIDPNNALAGALMIFAYRGYLVFLNTSEGNEQGVFNYPNRARWSAIGTPYYSSPVPNTPSLQTVSSVCMRDDLFGKGGANDAPTNEIIVSAGFIRDILVVYFERSTWRLRFVNNAQNPFVWERINVDYGSDCTFSGVTFDKGLQSIGDRGIVISDGNDTIRFDDKIPDDIFKIRQANQGFQRVYGLRTFRTRLVYWTYPSSENPEGTFPDKVLVYNYDTKNWSYYDDSFTCFGYYYPQQDAETWADMTKNWNTYNDRTWDSGIESTGFETPIAGNQQGYVFKLEQTEGQNDPSLAITAIANGVVTSNNHNLKDGQWITLSGVTGTTFADGVSLNGRNFKVANPGNNANTFTLTEFEAIDGPNASGTIFTGYSIGYVPIIPYSVQINVGALVFTDDGKGNLNAGSGNIGTIDYLSGALVLNFSPSIGSTQVIIRVVSYSNQQTIVPVSTTGAYGGNGQITVISNFDIQTKIFNFFGDDKRSRLSKIDFYTNVTSSGQFTCNVFADSSDSIINQPLPDNLQQNVVLTSQNPYQFGSNADQTIYRLFCDAIAQTVQLQLTMEDRQLAVTAINSSSFELVSMIVSLRRGGRLV